MKEQERYEVKFPDYALGYMVNADASGLEDEDIKAVDAYMQWYYDRAKEINGHVIFSCGDDEAYFTWNPEFGLACNVVDCIILIVT